MIVYTSASTRNQLSAAERASFTAFVSPVKDPSIMIKLKVSKKHPVDRENTVYFLFEALTRPFFQGELIVRIDGDCTTRNSISPGLTDLNLG